MRFGCTKNNQQPQLQQLWTFFFPPYITEKYNDWRNVIDWMNTYVNTFPYWWAFTSTSIWFPLCQTQTPDPYRLTGMWTGPGMWCQCLALHADVTFQRRARPPFWVLPQTQHITNHKRSGPRATRLGLALYGRTHSAFETRGQARNATTCRVLSCIVFGGIALSRFVATRLRELPYKR